MRFDNLSNRLRRVPNAWKVGILAFGWLLLISVLHAAINFEHESRQRVRMGYMPVITNLACPLMDEASKDYSDIRFESLKFASFADMAEALRNNEIQVAFMIAPLAITLRQQKEDVKVVAIGNRHESTLVARKDLKITSFTDLAGKTLAVPMRYSGHNLLALTLAEKYGMQRSLNIVEMNPPDMAAALAAGTLDAYFVGEPFAVKSLSEGYADLVLFAEDEWPGFICNLIVVKNDFCKRFPRVTEKIVHAAARSGVYARNNLEEAAAIAASYWNQPVSLVRYALTTPPDRTVFDRFTPREEELAEIATKMKRFGLAQTDDITGLAEDRFAKTVNPKNVTDIRSILD